jgi:hypothetical protein
VDTKAICTIKNQAQKFEDATIGDGEAANPNDTERYNTHLQECQERTSMTGKEVHEKCKKQNCNAFTLGTNTKGVWVCEILINANCKADPKGKYRMTGQCV